MTSQSWCTHKVTHAHAERANCCVEVGDLDLCNTGYFMGFVVSPADPELSVLLVCVSVAWRSRGGDGRERQGRSAPSSAPSCSASRPMWSQGECWVWVGVGGIHAGTLQHMQPFFVSLVCPKPPSFAINPLWTSATSSWLPLYIGQSVLW